LGNAALGGKDGLNYNEYDVRERAGRLLRWDHRLGDTDTIKAILVDTGTADTDQCDADRDDRDRQARPLIPFASALFPSNERYLILLKSRYF